MARFGQILEMDNGMSHAVDSRVLLGAMSRRVSADNGSTIDAISVLAANSADTTVRTALAEVANLLLQRADVHRALSDADMDAQIEVVGYLKQLCKLIGFSRLRSRNIRLLFIESRPHLASAERCWRLGLAVSEILEDLATNAAGDSGGVVSVEVVNSEAMLKCCIRYRGVYPELSRPDHGVELINALVRSIGGTFDFWHEGGSGESVMSVPSVGVIHRPPATWPDARARMSAT
jgi:two-component sensor histidine kinase